MYSKELLSLKSELVQKEQEKYQQAIVGIVNKFNCSYRNAKAIYRNRLNYRKRQLESIKETVENSKTVKYKKRLNEQDAFLMKKMGKLFNLKESKGRSLENICTISMEQFSRNKEHKRHIKALGI